jgi:hypothetical protein
MALRFGHSSIATLDLISIRLALIIADHRSLRLAAKAVEMSDSSVSHLLRRPEDVLIVAVRDLVFSIGRSAPNVTKRIRRMEDTSVIGGYAIIGDGQALGTGIVAYFSSSGLREATSARGAVLKD